jgi:hypothetical protein
VVASIVLACHVLDPRSEDAFAEFSHAPLGGEVVIDQQRLAGRRVESLRPRDESEARRVLLGIIDRATSQLEAEVALHEERDLADAAELANRLSFDASEDGERLRRFQMYCGRSLFRAIDALMKDRRAGAVDPTPPSSAAGRGSLGQGERPVSAPDRAAPDRPPLARNLGPPESNDPPAVGTALRTVTDVGSGAVLPTPPTHAPSLAPSDEPAAPREYRNSKNEARTAPLAALSDEPAAPREYRNSKNEARTAPLAALSDEPASARHHPDFEERSRHGSPRGDATLSTPLAEHHRIPHAASGFPPEPDCPIRAARVEPQAWRPMGAQRPSGKPGHPG